MQPVKLSTTCKKPMVLAILPIHNLQQTNGFSYVTSQQSTKTNGFSF